MANPLNPTEANYYTTASERLKRQYRYGSAQNRYESGQAAQAGKWGLADIAKQYGRARETLSDPFNQRGMMNSGIWQNALTRYNSDRTQALQRQALVNQGKQGGYDLTESQLFNAMRHGVSDLDAQKAAYRKSLATVIQGNI